MSEPLTAEEEAKFRESVRILEPVSEGLQWANSAVMRLLATLDAERLSSQPAPDAGPAMSEIDRDRLARAMEGLIRTPERLIVHFDHLLGTDMVSQDMAAFDRLAASIAAEYNRISGGSPVHPGAGSPPAVSTAAPLSSPETTPAGVLPPNTRLILASDNLLDEWGTRTERGERITVEWGEPSPEGWYEPVFTVHSDDRAGVLDEAWKTARKALRAQPGGSPYLTVIEDLMGWAEAQAQNSRGHWSEPGDTPAAALHALAAALGRSGSGGGRLDVGGQRQEFITHVAAEYDRLALPQPGERTWDHAYVSGSDNVCVTCGQVGSYAHTDPALLALSSPETAPDRLEGLRVKEGDPAARMPYFDPATLIAGATPDSGAIDAGRLAEALEASGIIGHLIERRPIGASAQPWAVAIAAEYDRLALPQPGEPTP